MFYEFFLFSMALIFIYTFLFLPGTDNGDGFLSSSFLVGHVLRPDFFGAVIRSTRPFFRCVIPFFFLGDGGAGSLFPSPRAGQPVLSPIQVRVILFSL